MPTFNPNEPQNGDDIDADILRDNFNALKGEIDALPAPLQGPPGPKGDKGDPGQPGPEGRHVGGVDDNGSGQAIIHMSDGALYGPFTVASGQQGAAGPAGSPGPGPTLRGDWNSAATYTPADVVAYNGNIYIAFDTASGSAPDSDARWRLLSVVGPSGGQGAAGERGEKGDKGDTGEPGPAGSPGEVTAAQLAQEISFAFGGTSANSNTVQPLDENADQAAIIAKMNELIAALRR
jgi:hypothetical protein